MCVPFMVKLLEPWFIEGILELNPKIEDYSKL